MSDKTLSEAIRQDLMSNIFEAKMSSSASDPTGNTSSFSGGIAALSQDVESGGSPITPAYTRMALDRAAAKSMNPLYRSMMNWLRRTSKKRDDEEMGMRRESAEIYENLGYSNPYSMKQPQKPEDDSDMQEIPMWDSLTGRKKKFKAIMTPPQDDALRSSREINQDMRDGYMQAAAAQRITQPSGGSDPRGFEVPYGFRIPVGANKDELDFGMSYHEYETRKKEHDQNPTNMNSAYADHPAVMKHLDQQKQLQQVQQADQMNAQGGEEQQQPGGMPGMGAGGDQMQQMMQQMMGGMQGGGQPQMPPMGGMGKKPQMPPMGGMGKKPQMPPMGKKDDTAQDIMKLLRGMGGRDKRRR